MRGTSPDPLVQSMIAFDKRVKEEEARVLAEEESKLDIIRKQMAPPGSLGLPELLEARRWHYAIPDGVFRRQVFFDRIMIWQLAPWDGGKFGKESRIHMPDTQKDAAKATAPRGIIVGAGLSALDVLKSNGSGIGHIVNFIRLAPWGFVTDIVDGHHYQPLVMRTGDLIADETLFEQLLRGEKKLVARTDDVGKEWHVFVPAEQDAETAARPHVPHVPEDY